MIAAVCVEQCNDLIAELALFRTLLTAREAEQLQQLVERASVHYPNVSRVSDPKREAGLPGLPGRTGLRFRPIVERGRPRSRASTLLVPARVP
jgi:hypothetical protein